MKLTRYVISFCFMVALLTYGSVGKTFYFFWFVACFISILFFMATMIRGKIKRDYVKLFLLLSMWMIYALIITPWTTNSNEHLKVLLLSFLYTLFSIICAILISKDFGNFIRFTEGTIIVWVALNFITLVLYYINIIDYDDRSFSGLYYNRNTLAITGLLFFSFLLFLKKELIILNVNFLYLIFFVLLLVLIFATESSKGLIGIVVILILYMISLKKLKRVISLAFIAISLFFIFLLTVDSGVTLRAKNNLIGFLSDDEEFGQGSGQIRSFLMYQGLVVASENLFTGVGVNNSKYHLFPNTYFLKLARGEDPGSGLVSHNNYIEMLLNGGLPAFMLYYGPVIWILFLLHKNKGTQIGHENFRKFLLAFIYLKLVLDIGMVSYMTFPYIFFLAVAYIFYSYYLQSSSSLLKVNDLENANN